MKLFFTETQLAHQPTQYMVHGRIVDPFENPNRATTLIESLQSVGLERAEPGDFGRAPILEVHADHYVAFLEEAYARFIELPNHGPEVLPNVHPYRGASRGLRRPRAAARHRHHRPRRLVHGRPVLRHHGGHLPCRLRLGADRDRRRGGGPGRRAGGLLALPPARAPRLRRPLLGLLLSQQRRHRRRGAAPQSSRASPSSISTPTTATARRRSSMPAPTCSTAPCTPTRRPTTRISPATPTRPAPGAGEGANLNLPLPWGADDAAFIAANARLCEAATAHGSEALVLSAGWDAHRDDPLSKLAVSTDAYARIGELYGKLGLPTLIVQEGGYSLPAIAAASRAFVAAFRAAHA